MYTWINRWYIKAWYLYIYFDNLFRRVVNYSNTNLEDIKVAFSDNAIDITNQLKKLFLLLKHLEKDIVNRIMLYNFPVLGNGHIKLDATKLNELKAITKKIVYDEFLDCYIKYTIIKYIANNKGS